MILIRAHTTKVGESIPTLLSERLQGSLPTQTEPNPKRRTGHWKVVTLRSGRELNQESKQGEQGLKKEKEAPIEGSTTKGYDKRKEIDEQLNVSISFPQRPKNEQHDKKFGRFIEIYMKLHISIPFAEVIYQMPKYSKFLKDIISNKNKQKALKQSN